MERLDFIVLGAGVTGLAYSRAMQICGHNNFIILDKNQAGGLCRSVQTTWGTADVGGGHMFCTKYADVERFVTGHLGASNWLEFDRKSAAVLLGNIVGYPVEEHLWQLPEEDALRLAMDILDVWKHDLRPSNFREWIESKFGRGLAEAYMLPYNAKLWGEPLDRMALSWLHKLPAVCPETVIRSIIRRTQDTNKLFHRRWKYPKSGGFQAIVDCLADPVRDRIVIEPVTKIEVSGEVTVNGRYRASALVNTIPWPEWAGICDAPMEVRSAMTMLEAVPLTVEIVPSASSPYQWVYDPSHEVSYHRQFFSSNWMPGAKFDFTETNSNRFFKASGFLHFDNKYAYPVYSHDRESCIATISSWSRKITGLGRWGRWDYANSDVCILHALEQAASDCRVPIDLICKGC